MRTITCAPRGKRAGGFTLFELLAVLAVAGLLGALFIPSWAQSRAEAKTELCYSNLQQIGRAVGVYVMDHRGKLPGCQHEQPSWTQGLAPYCRPGSFSCGRETEVSSAKGERVPWTYAINDFLTPHPYGARDLNFSQASEVPSPGETMIFGEAGKEYRSYDHFHFADGLENGFTADAFGDQVDVERHNGGANYLFLDGHVEELGWSSGARPKLNFAGSKFVHPAGTAPGIQSLRR